MGLKGEITVAGDKSISHRGVILGSIAEGVTKITGFLMGEDCAATIDCFRRLGVKIEVDGGAVTVYGDGVNGLKPYSGALDAKNSGTTARLLAGLLSGYPFKSVITGDASLQKRPMKRIIDPLTRMGAKIEAVDGNFCPMAISGGRLSALEEYTLPVASAQLKSALILAALNASGITKITEPEKSRDHTENMLKAMGGNISVSGKVITVGKAEKLIPAEITVPGDISSAAFFIVAALIIKDSEITVKNVGVNPTRTGILDVLIKMGGNIKSENKRIICGEPVCDITVKSSELKAVTVDGDIIPSLIDEIPILAVAFAFASGTSRIRGASELRVKESDRIKTIIEMLNTAGIKTEEYNDGFKVYGAGRVNSGVFNSHGDHRIAMSAKILSLAAGTSGSTETSGSSGESEIIGFDCAAVSYPGFLTALERLLR
jgi:3-phosphoshikimate 1-carboxyvinyltransferase